ncbi:cyclohexanone monooxygenase [Thozetella sp. PMI_491]|nr:cyclohexanone monooxygenase [Thozetella sp. PMI_491]
MSDNAQRLQLPVGNKEKNSPVVVIIGAGISGICAAIDLIKRNNCRNFVILEKSSGVGGTWLDNNYPGCCCDVESILYSFSFAQNSEWTRYFPGQEEILAYLTKVAQEYKLYQYIRFNTTVESATWDDSLNNWVVDVSVAKGSKEAEIHDGYKVKCDFLVSAVGQLSQPKWPDIEGLEQFDGKVMHSARWDWSYELKGKKVALIGNACSAVQILPEVAKVAREVTVFQRSPNWVTPRLDEPVSSFTRTLYHLLPPVQWWYRKKQMTANEEEQPALVDQHSEKAKSLRQMALDHLHCQLANRPDLWPALTPDYAVGCKRAIVSDDYYPTLALPHVHLETRSLQNVKGRAIHVKGEEGGQEIAVGNDFDVIICATGFRSLDFMHPIDMRGVGGRSVRDVWARGARAYNGTCVEDMPNFGMLFGPNTQLPHNSVILMIEAQSRYISGLIRPVLEARARGLSLSLRPRQDRVEAYNTEIQSQLRETSFNDPNCTSYYKTAEGVIVSTWPGKVKDYQERLSKVNYGDFLAEGSGTAIVNTEPIHTVGRVIEEVHASDWGVILGIASTAVVAAVYWSLLHWGPV